jgi:predicted acyl esterase
VPLVACVPLQLPEAVHEVALVELQVSVDAAPLTTLVGLADSAAVGRAVAATVTVAAAGALVPPAPVHFNEYVVLAVRAPVLCVPLVAFVPLQPPEAVQDVALVELQVSVDAAPLTTLVGLADSAAVGRAVAATVTVAAAGVLVPPAPVHANEYVVLAVRAPVP